MARARSAGKGGRNKQRNAPAEDESDLYSPTVGGWTLLAHPLLLAQLEKLVAEAEADRSQNPDRHSSANVKLLAHLLDLIFVKVPQNPGDRQYRQGTTLGKHMTHWFRAKTGNGRYRLFYRYDSASQVIAYAWVNDEQSLRTYGKSTDAYAVFRGMVESGNPPNDWDALREAASDKKARQRFRQIAKPRAPR